MVKQPKQATELTSSGGPRMFGPSESPRQHAGRGSNPSVAENQKQATDVMGRGQHEHKAPSHLQDYLCYSA